MHQSHLNIDQGDLGTPAWRSCITWSSFASTGFLTPPAEADDHTVQTGHLPSQQLVKHKVNLNDPSKVAVIGIGYVGLHLVKALATAFPVIAYDIDEARLSTVAASWHGLDVQSTNRDSDLRSATHFIIAVPTKLCPDKSVDTQHLRAALALVHLHAQPGSTVVIESSVAVGMTRSLLGPIIRERKLKGGMSPERVDPGRTLPAYQDIPKIISGLDDIAPGSLASIWSLYDKVFTNLVTVSRPEVAEMTKLYENCQRMMGIAYANEMADACEALGLDYTEVCAAARTKPFGYQPYNPGLGVGGHCIPVNPYYLISTSQFPLLEAATNRMMRRPARVCDRVMKRFYTRQRSAIDGNGVTAGSPMGSRLRVLVVGVAFKSGQSLLSNSPSVAFIQHLRSDEWDAHVEYADPLVPQEALPHVPRFDDQRNWNPRWLEEHFDIIVVAVDQAGLDMQILQRVQGNVMIEDFSSARGSSQKSGVYPSSISINATLSK